MIEQIAAEVRAAMVGVIPDTWFTIEPDYDELDLECDGMVWLCATDRAPLALSFALNCPIRDLIEVSLDDPKERDSELIGAVTSPAAAVPVIRRVLERKLQGGLDELRA